MTTQKKDIDIHGVTFGCARYIALSPGTGYRRQSDACSITWREIWEVTGNWKHEKLVEKLGRALEKHKREREQVHMEVQLEEIAIQSKKRQMGPPKKVGNGSITETGRVN